MGEGEKLREGSGGTILVLVPISFTKSARVETSASDAAESPCR